MIKWYVHGPKGWGWPGRCSVKGSTPNLYSYYPLWPDTHPRETGMFQEPLAQLIAEKKWMSLMDPDLEMDEGL